MISQPDRAGPHTDGTTDAELDRLLDTLIDDPDDHGSGAPRTPVRFARYTLHERIAEGGMGIVYRASRDDLPGFVALKIVPALFATPTAVARMRREAQIQAQLDIPGVVRIIESGIAHTELGEQPYIAMELVEGEHIDRYVERTAASQRDTVALICRLCEIIGHAHSEGVVHRDIKPSNVLVNTRGEIRVLDFGIARDRSGHASRLTQTGDRIGTPGYMSPEQQRGEAAGPVSDVFAVGVLARRLLESSGPATPRESRGIDRAIVWATASDAGRRCPTIGAFAAALRGRSPHAPGHRKYFASLAALLAITTSMLGSKPTELSPSIALSALLETDEAILGGHRHSNESQYAQLDRIASMTDGQILGMRNRIAHAPVSRRLADALALACWDRGLDGAAADFFAAAMAAAENEGLDPTHPTWHRQAQLSAESMIRVGDPVSAIGILDSATASANSSIQQLIGPAVASNVRSPVLRLWWTRAWAMELMGDTENAIVLLGRTLDSQHEGYPDHTDWLDSLDTLTGLLFERGEDDQAASIMARYTVPDAITDPALGARWSMIHEARVPGIQDR